jgi:hypothetical protein
LPAGSIGCGVLSTRKVSFSTYWSKADATKGRQTLVWQAAEEAGASVSGADHPQAAQLRCRRAQDHAWGRVSAAQKAR